MVSLSRELTRRSYESCASELDRLGYTDTALRTAWQQSKNENIAASPNERAENSGITSHLTHLENTIDVRRSSEIVAEEEAIRVEPDRKDRVWTACPGPEPS